VPEDNYDVGGMTAPVGAASGTNRVAEQAVAETVGFKRPLDMAQTIVLPPGTDQATVGSGVRRSGVSVSPAFDDHHPPAAELIDDCVHCGFCLPACPTYLLWGEEMDSPRGRIYLMKEGLEGEAMDQTMVRHFDQCLGCMSCVTACPSGVQYDKLIEATRAQVERRHHRPLADRLKRTAIFTLFPYPRRLKLARGPLRMYQRAGLGTVVHGTGLVRVLPRFLRSMEALAPKLGSPPRVPAVTPAVGRKRRTVAMLRGCVQGAFFPDVNAATVRVLAAEGCEVLAPKAQGCCGALSAHAGREDEALDFARALIRSLEDVDTVVVNAAGCGSNMKDYGRMLADDPRWAAKAAAFSAKVRDLTELLTELEPVAPRHPLDLTIAYHDACHLAHAQGIRKQPRELLQGIPGLQLKEIVEAEICCGSAGIYNLLEPDAARALGERKARNVLATEAQMLVTANPGCWMQIATTLESMGQRMPVAHTVQVLDASIRGLPVHELVESATSGPGTAVPRPASKAPAPNPVPASAKG
jgi:glycolate oxidase iron-sulfur subunit